MLQHASCIEHQYIRDEHHLLRLPGEEYHITCWLGDGGGLKPTAVTGIVISAILNVR